MFADGSHTHIDDRFRDELETAIIGLHAHLYRFLDSKRFDTKASHWKYFHELLGIKAHLQYISEHGLPSPRILNMQGPEALNSVVGKFVKNLTRGLSPLGTPNGKLSTVFVAFLPFVLLLLTFVIDTWRS